MFKTISPAGLVLCFSLGLVPVASIQVLHGDTRDATAPQQKNAKSELSREEEAQRNFERQNARYIALSKRMPAPQMRTELDRQRFKEFRTTVMYALKGFEEAHGQPTTLAPFEKLPKEEAEKMTLDEIGRYKSEVLAQSVARHILALEKAEKDRDKSGAAAALRAIRAETMRAVAR